MAQSAKTDWLIHFAGWLGFALAAVAVIGTARAQEPPAVQETLQQQIDTATRTLEAGDLAGAETLVTRLALFVPRNRQVRFLQAHLALAQSERARAITIFRDLLAEDPSLIRVRLDLARTLYETGNYEAARYHFELALGADVPNTVRRNIQTYLEALNFTESYFNVNAYVSNDSNANQGPHASTVYLFGLPFSLSSASQPQHSTGLITSVNARLAFGADRRSYVITSIEDREYNRSSFDYRYAQAGLGHSTLAGDWRLGVELGFFDSRFQRQALSAGPWGRLYGWTRLGPRVLVTPSLLIRRNDFEKYSYLSSREGIASLDASISLLPTLSVTLGVSAGRNSAYDPNYGYRSSEFRAGFIKEFPFGLIVDIQAANTRSWYDAEDPLFLAERRDSQRRLDIRITKRDWVIWRFAPTLFLSSMKDNSNIALNAWQRNVAGIGVTTRF